MAEETSARGVPKSELIEDVKAYLDSHKLSVEEAEVQLRQHYSKYKYVESSLTTQKARMADKIPEFNNSLNILETMIAKRDANESFETTFMLSDDVYSKAVVPKPEKASVWLGANVMVEYELDKAKELLEKNRASIQKVVTELENELAFIKDQITTTEVNMAHMVNYGVGLRQAAK